ncbi:hypothetical protein KQX54_012512 [Cotesia glomerata]|uniref:Uncharacterized protein n=1 Tax=Cotesia glomerata TaxID=32391 RepID=A0AAV7HIU8_COTGL|nr:hypothetical protein KQX54_012512 [Cotesia glomerata]
MMAGFFDTCWNPVDYLTRCYTLFLKLPVAVVYRLSELGSTDQLFYGISTDKGVKNVGNFFGKEQVEKPKKYTKPQKDEKTKKKQINENKQTHNEYFCIFRAGKYEEPPTEEWIMCYGCNYGHMKNAVIMKAEEKGSFVIYVEINSN